MKLWAGNIYLLASDQIWVYRTSEGGYGARQKWLSETQEMGESMVIDGNVWVLKCLMSNDQCLIQKFTRGVKEGFEVSGMDQKLGDGAIIYTEDEAEKLYILDKANMRVVVIKKNGEYDSQYRTEQAGQATDMVVAEERGKIYLLAGAKIWEIPL